MNYTKIIMMSCLLISTLDFMASEKNVQRKCASKKRICNAISATYTSLLKEHAKAKETYYRKVNEAVRENDDAKATQAKIDLDRTMKKIGRDFDEVIKHLDFMAKFVEQHNKKIINIS